MRQWLANACWRNALGRWIHVQTQLRVPRRIARLFVSRAEADLASAVLARRGYQPEPNPGAASSTASASC